MKKKYIAPEIEIVEIEVESHLMGLSAENSLPGTEWGGEVGGEEADANGRRGSWGNLWESESKSRW